MLSQVYNYLTTIDKITVPAAIGLASGKTNVQTDKFVELRKLNVEIKPLPAPETATNDAI